MYFCTAATPEGGISISSLEIQDTPTVLFHSLETHQVQSELRVGAVATLALEAVLFQQLPPPLLRARAAVVRPCEGHGTVSE